MLARLCWLKDCLGFQVKVLLSGSTFSETFWRDEIVLYIARDFFKFRANCVNLLGRYYNKKSVITSNVLILV